MATANVAVNDDDGPANSRQEFVRYAPKQSCDKSNGHHQKRSDKKLQNMFGHDVLLPASYNTANF
jgi:hypothetical protein